MYFFFLFPIVFKNSFTNPDVIENVKPQLAPIIPAPVRVANDAIEILPDNIEKHLMIYQNSLKKQYTY